MSAPKQRVDLFAQTLQLAFAEQGQDDGRGPAFLLLHGGAGPGSMAGLAAALATKARVVAPVHPGFDGEPRPEGFSRIADLVLAYLSLAERLALEKVVLVGNSLGGWIAAEMALRRSPRVAGVVLLDAVGIDTGSPDRVIVDPMKVPREELPRLSFHDAARFAFAPPSPEAARVMAENQRTLRVYAGEPFMFDPTLRARLSGVSTPTLVAWGQSDRIADVDYGRLFAQSIPGARFEVVPEAGHFPQIERPEHTVKLIHDFVGSL